MSQNVPECPRMSQNVSECPRMSQNVPNLIAWSWITFLAASILQMTGKTKRVKLFVVYWVIDHLYNYFFLFLFDLLISVSCFNETVLTFSYLYINKNKIQNESKTARWDFFKFLKPSSNLFKDDAKFQACWKNDVIKPNYCIIIFKQFWTCLKYDAIKTNYCIKLINAFKTSFSLS